MAEAHFVSERHALYTGWILGIALKHGIDLAPEVDDAGNYLPRLTLRLRAGPDRPAATVTLVVPPPPDDWTFNPEQEHTP